MTSQWFGQFGQTTSRVTNSISATSNSLPRYCNTIFLVGFLVTFLFVSVFTASAFSFTVFFATETVAEVKETAKETAEKATEATKETAETAKATVKKTAAKAKTATTRKTAAAKKTFENYFVVLDSLLKH